MRQFSFLLMNNLLLFIFSHHYSYTLSKTCCSQKIQTQYDSRCSCEGLKGVFEALEKKLHHNTKQNSRQDIDKVVEMLKAGMGYNQLEWVLNISLRIVQEAAENNKWSLILKSNAQLRHSYPPNHSSWVRRASVIEAAKKPLVTLEELQRAKAQVEQPG